MNRTAMLVACVLGGCVAFWLLLKPPRHTDRPVETPSTRLDSVVGRKTSRPHRVSPARPRSDTAASKVGAIPVGLNVPQVPPIDPRIETIVDRKLEEHARLEALLDLNNNGTTIEYQEDLDWVASLFLDSTAADTIRHEAANLLQNHAYPLLTSNLVTVLESPEEKARFRGFVVQHLWRRSYTASAGERAQILAILRTSLTDRDTPVKREALLALVRLREKDGQDAAVTWLTDPNEKESRDLAIRCIREMGLTNHLAAIRADLSSADEPARIQAIVTLSEWGDAESKAGFESAATSTNVRLQRAGQAALRRLAAVPKSQP